tara:strand:+ start:11691 stop:12743 length:1053 start_codon:yes stop_codon:yes gene_type:complete
MIIQVGGQYTLTRRRGIWQLHNINRTGSSDFINSMFKLANINPGSFSDENKTPAELFRAWFQSSGLDNELKRRSEIEGTSNSRNVIVLGKRSDRGNRRKIPILLDNLLNNVDGDNVYEKIRKLDREIYKVSSSGGGISESLNDQLQGRGTGSVRISRDKVLNYLNQHTSSLRTRESSGRSSNAGHSYALTNSQNAATASQERLNKSTEASKKRKEEKKSLKNFDESFPDSFGDDNNFPSKSKKQSFDYTKFVTSESLASRKDALRIGLKTKPGQSKSKTLMCSKCKKNLPSASFSGKMAKKGPTRRCKACSSAGGGTRKKKKRRQSKKAKKKSKKKTRKKSLKNIFKYFF